MSSLHSPSPTRRSAPSRRGRALAAIALAAVVPLAAGCGAGFTSETQAIKPDSGNGSVGPFKINNVWVVQDAKTGNAEIIGAVANTGSTAGTMTGVEVSGHTAAIASPMSTPQMPFPKSESSQLVVGAKHVGIGPAFSVNFGQPGFPELEIPGAHLQLGSLTTVAFTFAGAGSAHIVAQVVTDTGLWASYNPNGPNIAKPSVSASASTSASVSSSPVIPASEAAQGAVSPTATASASASPSPSAS
ncbi:MAG TPA: hypothetical protein VGM10_14475 [Actinocrinis sp.]